MGKTRRKFNVGFKQQVVQEVEAGLVTKAQAARKYDLSAGLIDRWVLKYQNGTLVDKPSTEEKALRAENERLKAKIGELTMTVDLLKKMEAFAQERRKETSSVVTAKTLGLLRGGAK